MNEQGRLQRSAAQPDAHAAARPGMAGPQHGRLTQLAAMLAAGPPSRLRAQAHVISPKPKRAAEEDPANGEAVPVQRMAIRAPDLAPMPADAGVVQRYIQIGGGKRYGTLKDFKKSPIYAEVIGRLNERHEAERVEYHLNQLISTNNSYENAQQFEEVLEHDITHKSAPGEPLTLQEQYMTEYGWRARRDAPKSASATPSRRGRASAPSDAPGPSLKVYRTMSVEEWEQLRGGDFSALVKGHLGDFKQAQRYLYGQSKPKVLVEFILKPGAERALFSTGAMAFPDRKHKRKVPDMIRDALINEGSADAFAQANPAEGLAEDRVGIKAEQGEAGFSLGIGGGTSPDLFRSFVESMHVIGESDGRTVAPRGRGVAHDEEESKGAYDEDGHDAHEEAHGAPHDGMIHGVRYDPGRRDIRAGGECLWDTLRVGYGYTPQQLQDAAEAVNLQYEQHVDDNMVWPLLRALGAGGMTLDAWQYGREDEAWQTVRGDGSIRIGLAYDPDNQGHYIPPS
jgi:hypothetical protein